ncbi:MAG: exosortase/archaeosortase family protein [Opitutae bacterium]|nr:exosortase/archaeosortase family protein [Opitutae bacterium]
MISIWGLIFLQLSTTWNTNEQYAHGFLVPFLCFYLLLKSEPFTGNQESKKSLLQGKTWFLIGIPLLLSLLPLWTIRGANSDWRLLNFVLFGIVFLLTVIPFYDQGGWSRIKNLIFPLLFFTVAIPWPLATDLQLTQWFQERISSIIVDILLLLEHEASLQGTVIDVGIFGQVGIDQACSGINGLQSSIVVTLFFGAYYRFRWINRVVLILSGAMIAIGFNLLRAFSLSYIKVKGKGHLLEDALFSIGGWDMPSLHDLAGWIETSLIFLFIYLLARSARGGLFLRMLSNEPNNWSNLKSSPPLGYSLLTISTVIASVSYANYHFESRESNLENLPKLSLNIADDSLLVEEKIISNQIAAQLHFESAQSIQWQERLRTRYNPTNQTRVINPNQEYWQAFEATWESGGACTAILSTHSPDSCLPLTGLTQINPPPGQAPTIITIQVENREISFEVYEFTKNRKKLYVFRCFWPRMQAIGQANQFPKGGYSLEGRIQSTLEGRRNVGGTMLALALANVDSPQTALAKLQALANQRLSFGEKEVQ